MTDERELKDFVKGNRGAGPISLNLRPESGMRRIATIITIEGTSLDVLSTGGTSVSRNYIPVHEIMFQPVLTPQELSSEDPVELLTDRLRGDITLAESKGFAMGNGIDQPVGIGTHPLLQALELGMVRPDDVINLIQDVSAMDRQNGWFVMHEDTLKDVMRFRDGDGRLAVSQPLAAGSPFRLYGYPVLMLSDMPSKKMVFGDISKGYGIAQRPYVTIFREALSDGGAMFHASHKVGGDITDMTALRAITYQRSDE